MRNFARYILILCAALLWAGLGSASPAAVATDSITASVITCYPGGEIYEVYGHTAIRMRGSDFDEVFNYGVFDFYSANFVYRFVKGDAMYLVVHYPYEYFIPEYRERGSKVVEQVLNLPQTHVHAMLDYLLWNCQPQNRAYRYDYIGDNCSTRPRDIVERAVGGTIEYPADTRPELTFRDIMREYNGNYPWLSLGIDLALGADLDKPTTAREKMFAPLYLKKALDGATYTDSTGQKVPVVLCTNILNPGADCGAILPPTPWWQTPTVAAALLLLLVVALSAWDLHRGKVCRVADTVIYTLYAAGGCIVWFLIFVSLHAATGNNFVGLWLHPLYLFPAIAEWLKSAKKGVYWYHFINFAVLILALVAWWIVPQRGDASFVMLMLVPMVRQATYLYITKKECDIKRTR